MAKDFNWIVMGLIFLLGFLFLIFGIISFLIGLYKVLFQKDDKKFGIQLLIFSSIVIIIGLGACGAISNLWAIEL